MRPSPAALAVAAVMCLTSVAAVVARPSATARGAQPAVSLEAIVPKNFGDWTLLPEQGSQVVNPLVKEELDRIYSQILSRTYVDKQGYRIMLSLAYGDDQRGGLQAHRPEVCYPGQGFRLAAIEDGALATDFGAIEVRRMQTSLGARKEPVTYWLTVGDRVINGKMDKRIAEIRLALTGQIPDGLLFRVSSIDPDPRRAFEQQQRFAAQMLTAVPPKVRKQLSGLGPADAAG
jgi:EpsI family protein